MKEDTKKLCCDVAGAVVGGCSAALVKKALGVYLPADLMKNMRPWVYSLGVYGIGSAVGFGVGTAVGKDVGDVIDIVSNIRLGVKKAMNDYKVTVKINDGKEADDGGSSDAGQQQSEAE